MRRVLVLLAAALVWTAAACLIPAAARASTPETTVKVERAAPPRKGLPTVQFLQENRDFFRRQVDVLKVTPVYGSAPAVALDPRALAHGEALSEAMAGLDTLSQASEGRALLDGVDRLVRLESELDDLERLLVEQNGRLSVMESDFLHDQGTAMVVVLRGVSDGALPDSVRVIDAFGDRHVWIMTAAEREALHGGGVVQVTHALLEPRDQTWSLALCGGGWDATPAYLSIDPARDALTYLEFDLTRTRPDEGAAGLHPVTWVDGTPAPHAGDGRTP
jgi:hypothetical protein